MCVYVWWCDVMCSDVMCVCVAIAQLDRCKWWGKNLKVSMSKHTHVQMPRDGASVRTSYLGY